MILAKKFLMCINKPSEPYKPYLEFVSSTPMTITPNYTNAGITLQYSLDTVTWNNINAKGTTTSANTIYFRGIATGTKSLFTSSVISNPWKFNGATNLEVKGNINTLIQDTLGSMVMDIPLGNYAFSRMFQDCTSLTTPPELPSTALATNCYMGMFYNCTRLTVAPVLPSTALAAGCYYTMFYGCTSLTTAPALPATTLAFSCYSGMFQGCTSLTIIPSLPATTLANYCYNGMFRDCTSLTTPPELPVTTLATGCYNGMFYNCTRLTVAPVLPSTALATNCYSGMFQGCTSLTIIPSLPATTLANNCYDSMFYGCTSLKFSLTKDGDYQTAYRVPTVGTGIDATNSFVGMFNNTGGTFVGTPSINTTYYTENQVI